MPDALPNTNICIFSGTEADPIFEDPKKSRSVFIQFVLKVKQVPLNKQTPGSNIEYSCVEYGNIQYPHLLINVDLSEVAVMIVVVVVVSVVVVGGAVIFI